MKVFEMRIYTCYPGKLQAALEMWEKEGQFIISRHMKMIGQWTGETGTVNKIYSLWEYASYDERMEARKNLLSDPDFIPYIAQCRKNYCEQEVIFLNATNISPIL